MLYEILSHLDNDETNQLFDQNEIISYKELIRKSKHLQIGPTKDNWVAIPEDDSLSSLMTKILGAIIQQVNFVVVSKTETKEIKLPVLSEIKQYNVAKSIQPQSVGQSLFGIQTSGSSGKKKIIVHPIENLFRSAEQLSRIIENAENSTWNLSLPVYHIGGLSILFRALMTKRPVRKINKNDLAQSKIKGIISLVSAQLPNLLENTQLNPKDISIHLGGGRANTSLLEKCLERGFNIYNSYGLSEYCSTFSIKKMSLGQNYSTSGDPLSDAGFKIYEKKLFISGPNLFIGTLNITTIGASIEKVKLIKIIDSEKSFYPTSDLAEELNGELLIHGRDDEVIISGGKNISINLIKKKIEFILKQFPLFSSYYVITYPHDKWGETYSIFFDTSESEIPHSLREKIKGQLNNEIKPNSILQFNSLKDIKGIKPTKDELLDIIRKDKIRKSKITAK